MNLISYTRPQPEINTIKNESNIIDYNIFNSQPIFAARNFLLRYFNYFSSRLLLFEGDWSTARHSAPYTGVLLFPTFFFFIYGLVLALKHYRTNIFFLSWLSFAVIPAALSLDIIQAVRGLNLSIPIIYFAALGLSSIINKKNTLFIVAIYIASFAYYSDMYYNHLTKIKPEQSLVGYKEAIQYIEKYGQNRQIIITNFYGQAYIYYLFYTKYLPQTYQKQANLITNGVDTGIVEKIDNILFKSPDINQIKNSSQKTIAILSYDEIIRQGYNTKDFIKISPIFYAYQN